MYIILFMTTFVSSFIINVNNTDRTIERYLEFGKHFLNLNINKVVFVSEEICHLFTDINENTTKIIPYKKENMYLYEYKDSLVNFELSTDNESKDTVEYMFLMCHKTEFIRDAISRNIYGGDNYIWVDFGIKHIFKNYAIDFNGACSDLKDRMYDNIRIGKIWDLNLEYEGDIYKKIKWYFAGGIFGGNKDSLLKFADLTKEKCIEIMTNNKTIMWEVNIWYMIYLNNKELFNPYPCDHNATMFFHY